jgi:6-phosphogluconate dehydrogenase
MGYTSSMKDTMAVVVLGLGRMGSQIVRRLNSKDIPVYGWNRIEESEVVNTIREQGIFASTRIADILEKIDPETQRVFWIMVPHEAVEEFLFGDSELAHALHEGDIVIDGGNSFYKNSIVHAERLRKKGIHFFDAGTSGGVWGEKNGFALMVGGDKDVWPIVEPIFAALSSGSNYSYLGKAGAGHFAKMVHNGIEYGMMEAIAEGYGVLDASDFDFNLADVTRVYQEGSVIRSWLIDLCAEIFSSGDIEHATGEIDATGEGEWTITAGKELGVDVRVIEDALKVRQESANPANQTKFSNKLVALLRNRFGGHATHGNT